MTMHIWDALKRPPAEALKKITGGRLNGMTDINPQWRMRAMTEEFGPVGSGWRYTIDRLWTEPGVDGEVCAFAQVSLYVKQDDEWSDAIPGIGGSKLIEKERKGPHTNDECYKMAVTDALSVAMKALGLAADIYLGQWDGSKYRDPEPPPGPQQPNKVETIRAIKRQWINARHELDDKSDAEKKRQFTEWFKTNTGTTLPTTEHRWSDNQIEACRKQLDKEAAASEAARRKKHEDQSRDQQQPDNAGPQRDREKATAKSR